MKRNIVFGLFLMLFVFVTPAFAMEMDAAVGAAVVASAEAGEISGDSGNAPHEASVEVIENHADRTSIENGSSLPSSDLGGSEETNTSRENASAMTADEGADTPAISKPASSDDMSVAAADVPKEKITDTDGEALPVLMPENAETTNPSTTEDASTAREADAVNAVEEKSGEIEGKEEAVTLEKGTMLEAAALVEMPMALSAGETLGDAPVRTAEVHVSSFEALKEAIKEAPTGQSITIVIDQSFELKEKLTIQVGRNITLTAANKRAEEKKYSWEKTWKPIKQPADVADEGEAKQREVIEEARHRGDEAMQEADAPLPDEAKGDTIIKRAKDFITDTLFDVRGKLALGTEESALYIDGNREIQTKFADKGAVIDVNGDLTMKNAVIMNANNGHGYTAPILVKENAMFQMDGGRISQNTSYEQVEPPYSRPTSAGAVYVQPGGIFRMTNGLIDHNRGNSGGIFAGNLYGSDKNPATVAISGGIIAKNEAISAYYNPIPKNALASGGGIRIFPKAKLDLKDGIIAGNDAGNTGGGIAVSDQFISEESNIINAEFAKTPTKDYTEHLKKHKAQLDVTGGLIYKNHASRTGGGLYIDSNHATFTKGMILDNKAGNFGGGIYVSFPPRVQTLVNLLITENKAGSGWYDFYGGGNGGGIWNCPTGYVHIGDGHSIYAFNNEADSYGKDLTFSKKTSYFLLNDVNIKDVFYSHVSPITKDKNIIKFLEDGEKGVDIPKEMSYTNDVIHLKALYDALLQAEAWKNAQTFILGNTARNGGGIGSNANLETPNDDGEYNLKVKKKWDSSIDARTFRDKTIKADLFIVPLDKDEAYVRAHYGIDPKLYKYGEIELNAKNNWESLFHTQGTPFSPEVIKNFPTIKGWNLAYNKDKGLPFTAEALKTKGFKYLVVEQGKEFFSTVEEFPEEKASKTQVQAGAMEVRRVNHKGDTEYDWSEPDIFLYRYDQDANQGLGRLVFLTREKLDEANDHKAILKHPQLMGIDAIEYYGNDRRLKLWGKGWYDSKHRGFESYEPGNAFVLVEKDGKKTLLVPYLWTMYDKKSGYYTEKLDDTTITVDIPGKPHTFEITNYRRVDLPVEKVWQLEAEDLKNIPDAVKVYLLLDHKRILIGYEKDKDGHYLRDEQGRLIPMYQSLVLEKDADWKGRFENLNPEALVNHRYSVEEEENGYLPFFSQQDNGKISFRIGFESKYHSIDDPPNFITAITDPFREFLGDVTLHLHIRRPDQEEEVLEQIYLWEKLDNLDIMIHNRDKAIFKDIPLGLKGMDLRVKTYDAPTNELGMTDYHFYLQPDEKGFYTLYMPTVMINGVPYGQFKLEDFARSADDSLKGKIENYPGPNHDIDIEKLWHGDTETDRPATLKITIRDKDGKVQELFLTKDDDWKAALQGIQGKVSAKDYELVEEALDKYRSEKAMSVELALRRNMKEGTPLLPIKSYLDGEEIKDAAIRSTTDFREVRIDSKTLSAILLKGNYKYQLYKPQDGAEEAVRVIRNEDGSYIIELPIGVKIAEVIDVKFNNFYTPSTPPDNPPDTPPSTPPDNPPDTPPSTPPDTPPSTPPDNPPDTPPSTPPDNPPDTPPSTPPDHPPVIPEKPDMPEPIKPIERISFTPPVEDINKAPKTFDPGIGSYGILLLLSLLALLMVRKAKEEA